jgi:BEN domain
MMKVQELSQENFALKEINIQLQLKNYKLQKQIEKLELAQFPRSLSDDDEDQSYVLGGLDEITIDPTAEYLEDETLTLGSPPLSVVKVESGTKRKRLKRTIDEVIADDKILSDESDLKSAHLNAPEYEEIEANGEADNDGNEIDPTEATKTIYQLAAKNGTLDKLKQIDTGKQKDSSFVNKILNLVFERATLASSSAQGKKCQSKLHLPPRPALDPDKLNICRQAFVYRLKREGLSYPAREERLKCFNGYVNFNIQNARKLSKK